MMRVEREMNNLKTSLIGEPRPVRSSRTDFSKQNLNTNRHTKHEKGHEDDFHKENTLLREKLANVMDGSKPEPKKLKSLTVQNGASVPPLRSRSPAMAGTPHVSPIVGQVGEPTRQASASIVSITGVSLSNHLSPAATGTEGVTASDGAAGVSNLVRIPVGVEVEQQPQQHQPQHQPQQQPQDKQQLQQQQPKQQAIAMSSSRLGGSIQLPIGIGRPPTGSLNVPIGCSNGLAGSVNLPVGAPRMRSAGGSMHVPSVGPICFSTHGSAPLRERANSSPPPPGLQSAQVPSRLQSTAVYAENSNRSCTLSNTVPELPLHGSLLGGSIPGGSLSQSVGRQRLCMSQSNTRTFDRLGGTVPPSTPLLANTMPLTATMNPSMVTGPAGPARATVPPVQQ